MSQPALGGLNFEPAFSVISGRLVGSTGEGNATSIVCVLGLGVPCDSDRMSVQSTRLPRSCLFTTLTTLLHHAPKTSCVPSRRLLDARGWHFRPEERPPPLQTSVPLSPGSPTTAISLRSLSRDRDAIGDRQWQYDIPIRLCHQQGAQDKPQRNGTLQRAQDQQTYSTLR